MGYSPYLSTGIEQVPELVLIWFMLPLLVVIRLWNNLLRKVVEAPSLEIFVKENG